MKKTLWSNPEGFSIIVRGYQQGKIEEKEKVVTDFRDSV